VRIEPRVLRIYGNLLLSRFIHTQRLSVKEQINISANSIYFTLLRKTQRPGNMRRRVLARLRMPPFAVCSNEWCPIYLDLHEEREGPSRVPPQNCPNCRTPLIWFCHVCSWPLIQIPNRRDPRCSHCNRSLPFTSEKSFVTSDGDKNMPYALCSNRKCDFSIELHDGPSGLSRPTPGTVPAM